MPIALLAKYWPHWQAVKRADGLDHARARDGCFSAAVAHFYGDLLDGLIIDKADEALAKGWKGPGIHITDTIMCDQKDKTRLAGETVRFIENLRRCL